MHNQTGHGSGQLGFSPPRELWEFSVGPSRFVPLPGTGAGRLIHQLPSVLCREPLPPRELQVLAVGIHQAEDMRRVLQRSQRCTYHLAAHPIATMVHGRIQKILCGSLATQTHSSRSLLGRVSQVPPILPQGNS